MQNPTLDNFVDLVTNEQFQRYFLNSVWVTVLVVILSMMIAILAAFACRAWASRAAR